MSVKLSLTAKSVLLVSIPLLFEVGLVWALLNLQHDTEEEARQAMRASDVTLKLGIVSGKMFAVWKVMESTHEDVPDVAMTLRIFSVYKTKFEPLLADLYLSYGKLAEQVKDQPEFVGMVRESADKVTAIHNILDSASAEINNGHFAEVAKRYPTLSNKIVSLFEDLVRQDLAMGAKSEHIYAELSARRHSASRGFMINFVLATCALNAVFCVVLALFLVKGIVSRLGVMTDNASRLAANQSLNPPIAGQDEIADLDKVFHNMANTLEETARMRQELVSMLTHDLRSPLTAIQGSLELLDVEIKKEKVEREGKLVDVAMRNSSRMMRLINDLLDIQKIKAGVMTFKPASVCLAEVFEDVALSVSSWIEDSDIKLIADDTDLFVLAEREKVERIVFNLVANAIKFSPQGGQIKISAAGQGDMIQVSVSDQGRGIPSDQLASIFERFQQIEGDEKQSAGSGLGLTICQYLVNLQGGKITVQSEPGKGSCFSFTLLKA